MCGDGCSTQGLKDLEQWIYNKGQQNLLERLKTTECACPWRDQGKALGSADCMV